MFVVGKDIGYSNLKLAFGDSGKETPTLRTLPATAVPEEALASTFVAASDDALVRVTVDGKPWVVGASTSRILVEGRELHEDYTRSRSWRALFHAGLLVAGEPVVDRLVVGLPVGQFNDAKRRDRLVRALQGVHPVSPDREVEVRHVEVIPQPGGTFIDRIVRADSAQSDSAALMEGRVLVVDPGWYSMDWALFDHGAYRKRSSGSSLSATSSIAEEAARNLERDRGVRVAPESFEEALRAGSPNILAGGSRLDIAGPLETASLDIAHSAALAMRQALRAEAASIDLLLLTGGGATLFEAAVREAFPGCPVEVPPQPVLANVRGYWSRGCASE